MASVESASVELQETESETAIRLQVAFECARNPMLMVDDQRRCVSANATARDLLGIEQEEVPWHRIDDFAPAEDRDGLDEHWQAFLMNGAMEGWYRLPLPTGGMLPIEFSATANVLPGRHLTVVMTSGKRPRRGRGCFSDVHGDVRIAARDARRLPLTAREREVLGLVARGLKGGEIAQHLALSPETIKSHVQNALTKLGAHTRAHAVAIALRAGEIETLPQAPPTGVLR